VTGFARTSAEDEPAESRFSLSAENR